MLILVMDRKQRLINHKVHQQLLGMAGILSRHQIGIPRTAFVRDRTDVWPAIERVGGAPVIIKLLEGTQGVGVILADSRNVAAAIIETLQSTRQNVLLQKFVAESKGRDVRAFVVGDRVVADQPLVSVETVDADGAAQLYTARFALSGGRLRLKPFVALPAIPPGGHADVTFVTGYGAAEQVPEDLVQAILKARE